MTPVTGWGDRSPLTGSSDITRSPTSTCEMALVLPSAIRTSVHGRKLLILQDEVTFETSSSSLACAVDAARSAASLAFLALRKRFHSLMILAEFLTSLAPLPQGVKPTTVQMQAMMSPSVRQALASL